MAQLVAHHTGSVGVRGSSPLSSTRKTQTSASYSEPFDDHFDDNWLMGAVANLCEQTTH